MLDHNRIEPEAEPWTLDGVCGSEQWQSRDGRFTSVLVGSKRLTLAEQPFDLDQLGLRAAPCGHAGPWPNAFRFCPQCGATLSAPAERPSAAGWAPPSGASSGLAVFDTALSPNPASRREEAMPPAASLSFIATARLAHLFAYDGRTGRLHVRNEDGARWEDLVRLPAATTLPRWSWAAALVPPPAADSPVEGFALPTDEGPVFVRAGPLAPLMPVAAAASLGIRRAAGGVICLRGRPFAPVHLAGGLGLARLSAGGDGWDLVAVQGGETVAPDAVFAAPASHADDAFWFAASGQLSVSLTGTGGCQAHWQPWPEGLVPLLGVRPLQEPNGTLHQLMRLGSDQMVFRALRLPGAPMEQRTTPGPWLSAGRAAFREGKRRRLPWDEAGSRGDYSVGDGEFLLPLLDLDEKRFLLASCAGRTSLLSFLDTAAPPAESRSCTLLFSRGTRSLDPLGTRIDARSAWDIVPFVHRERLHVYAANANRCWSWALGAGSAG